MNNRKPWKRLLSMAMALIMLICLIPTQTIAGAAQSAGNQNNNTEPVEEWVYTPEPDSLTIAPMAVGTTADSSADIVKVHVTATDRNTNEKISVAGASVNLYVGADYHGTFVSDENGIAEVSLAGLSYTQRKNATISASKVVSRGKAIDGTDRDDLFEHFPKDDAGEYYRYTLELHSETIDTNGNWLGAEIPTGKESNKVDIVFIIDATGSMSNEINAVKNNIASFSENLIDSGLDIRFCIIDYRDITISGEDTNVYTVAGSHWMNDIDSVINTLASISVSGGGDTPETVIDPLGYVADNGLMSWRSDAYRFAFVLTDANHKTANNYGYNNLNEVADKLAEMEVVTSVICSSSYNDYQYLYEKTGGIWANINSSNFASEMLTLSDSIIESVVREMTLELKEPRLLVNMAVCYFADDKTSQSDSYKESVKTMLKTYSEKLAEATDAHVMIDKVLLFSTNNRMNFYDTNAQPSMADIQIQSEVKDDGTWWNNVEIHNNAYVFGFFTDDTLTVDDGYMDSFFNLKDADKYKNRTTFQRILSGGIDINDYSMIDDVVGYAATQAHETGHYLMGFRDEYQRGDGADWRVVGNKPYNGNFGLMDNQYDDIELSRNSDEYAYMSNNYTGTSQLRHTEHSWTRMGSCEDTLADWMTNANYNDVYGKIDDSNCDYDVGNYVSRYTKVSGTTDHTATYPYSRLENDDFRSPNTTGSGGGGGSAWSLNAIGTHAAESVFTKDSVADVSFTSNEATVTINVSGDVAVGIMKAGDEDFANVALTDGTAELPIAKGELAEVRITDTGAAKYNTYYVDRSEDTDAGYLYTAADNAVMAYVTTDELSSYTFIADNTGYENGAYRSVNQATRITSDNGAGFDSGEIYSVADYLSEIDYTTLSWFKYADGEWTALATDYSEEENMNIGARADLAGEGLYVLMAKKAAVGGVLPAENLTYTQSEDRDAVVTLTFDDPNADSKYYNVYYSEEVFTDKNAEGVVVRSFDASSTSLTINLLERGRKVYAAVEIVAEDGRRSELSEIILIGGEADSDGDGIPDWYCDKYHLWGEEGEDKDIANSDDDGDGLTNLEEYLGGSDPTDPNDPIHTTNVPVESISISSEYVKLFVGASAAVTAEVLPANATNKNVTWSSADDRIASVSVEDGICVISANSVGRTQVYAVTADGGFSATITVEVDDSLPFADVVADAWYCDAVEYVYHNGLMIGVGGNRFAPGEHVTRGMAVTVVHRLAGSPVAESEGFRDVSADAWYADAVYWAQANDIVNGYGDGTFRPNADMTREELAAVFYRYAQRMGYDVSASHNIEVFSDCEDINAYAEDAMSWAVSVGLIQGFPDGSIRPQTHTNRAELAMIMMRFVEMVCG